MQQHPPVDKLKLRRDEAAEATSDLINSRIGRWAKTIHARNYSELAAMVKLPLQLVEVLDRKSQSSEWKTYLRTKQTASVFFVRSLLCEN